LDVVSSQPREHLVRGEDAAVEVAPDGNAVRGRRAVLASICRKASVSDILGT
jgi:hypothetical protein